MQEYSIREGLINDIPYLIDLMFAQYEPQKGTGYFLWQFFHNPLNTILVVTESKGKIVGLFGLQQRTLKNGIKVGQAIDMLLNSNYRGLGIFKEMIEFACGKADNPDILFVLPNLNGKNAVEKLGWQTVGKIDDMVWNPKLSYDIELDTTKTKPTNTFFYSEEILKWRFDNHPENKYERISLTSDTFAFVKTFHDKVNNAIIGDLVYLECLDNDFRRLISLVLDNFQSKRVNSISCWALKGSKKYNSLLEMGFRILHRERYLCIKQLHPINEDIFEMISWDLHKADAEFY